MQAPTTNIFEEQIRSILQRLKITSKHSFVVDEKLVEAYPKHAYAQTGYDLGNFGSNTNSTTKEARQNLTNALVNELYSRFYCAHTGAQNPLPPIAEREAFMNTLSAANCSTEGLDYYWKVYHVSPNGQAFAQKNGVLRPLIPHTYTTNTTWNGAPPNNAPPAPPVINQYVHFHRQKENRKAQPVFYHIFGKEYLSHEGTLARIYWHIQPEGAATLIAEISNSLNSYNIPFSFKCLNHKALYTRSDSAVLYFDKKHLSIIQMMLPAICQKVEHYLQDSIPMFTKQLYKGVAFAEDPGNGQSFGMSRVEAIAEALVEAFQQDIQEEEALLDFVLTYMETMGISRTHMYLNPRLQNS
ncbi:MAG: T3SS effector HopA1 family protein [Aureispira sp.]